jgi:fibro-slime domain-containing protein
MAKSTRNRFSLVIAPALMLLSACRLEIGGLDPSGEESSPGIGMVDQPGDDPSGGDDQGMGTGADPAGSSDGCSAGLRVLIRDFHASHLDFEDVLGDDRHIVREELGEDDKPVYAGEPITKTTHGEQLFDEWYRDVPGVNKTIRALLKLSPKGDGVFAYDNAAYFPIDDQGFGNEGNSHNYHFTTEAHARFVYKGGEALTFAGDDDLFAFINHRLIINLGGVHASETATVHLDEIAEELGLKVGQTYPIDLFSAERHTAGSHFRLETTIGCFATMPPP